MIKQDPRVQIEPDEHAESYRPGETISGRYRLNPVEPIPEVQALEWSIAWTTEGKGDEDRGVHVFETINEPDGAVPKPEQWRRFEAVLPPSPLSYDGLIVKLLWRVRVRAVFGKKREWIGEYPFQLGNVDRAHEPQTKQP